MKIGKPEQDAVSVREMHELIMPLAIAKSLLAMSSGDKWREVLYKKVGVFNESDTTVLVGTDAKSMLIAASPSKLDIATGTYAHEIIPVAFNGKGKMLLSKHHLQFPNYTKIEKMADNRKLVGSLDTTSGKLQSCEPFCLDYRRFTPFCPGVYQMFTCNSVDPLRVPYVFVGKYNDWTLTYFIMPMTGSDI